MPQGMLRGAPPCRAAALVLFAAAMLAAGCGGPTVAKVRGQVTYKGKPVTEGTVTFISTTTKYNGEATLDSEGNYVMNPREGGLVVGEYVVVINPPIVMDSSDPKTPPSPVEKRVGNIPQKYRNQGTSPLKREVKQGIENVFDFDLSK